MYSFALFLCVALHSCSGQYRPEGAYVSLRLLITILFRCRSQKAKSLVSCPLLQLEQPLLCRNAPAIHPRWNKGTHHALQRVFKLVCVAVSMFSHPELFPVLTPLIVTGQVGSQKGVELVW